MNFDTTRINPLLMPSDEGSDNWDTTFLVGHCALFTFNFFNFMYILLFEGFVYRRLMQNRLLQIGIFAPIFHLVSCASSIHRYNIDVEYGIYARVSTILSFMAAIPLNGVYLYLIFPRKPKVIICGWAIWIISAVTLAIVGEVNFEEVKFRYVRSYIGAYAIYQTVALAVGHQHLKRGRISISPSIISQAEILRLFKLLFFIDFGVVVVAASKNRLFGLPATGALFTVMVIAMTFVGKMDFMTGESTGDAKPASEPGTKDALESEELESSNPSDLAHSHSVEEGGQNRRAVSFTSQGNFPDDSFDGDIEAPNMTQFSSEETPEKMVDNLKSVVNSLTDQWSQLMEAIEKATKSESESLDLAPPVKEVTSDDGENRSKAILNINAYDTIMTSEPEGEESVLKPSMQGSVSGLTVGGKGRSASKKAPAVKQAKKKKRVTGKHAPDRMRDSVDPPANESNARFSHVDPPTAYEPTTTKNADPLGSGVGGHSLPSSDDSSTGSGYATPDE